MYSADRVSREPLGHQIANALRNDILAGRVQPGEHLSQKQVCEQFGTSRIPVRDALLMLSHEGFVVDVGGGRVRVTRMTTEDILDIYRIEGFLKGMACRRVAERILPEELEELRGLHNQLQTALDNNRDDDVVEINWMFHRRINQISGSAKLVAAIRPLALSIPRGFIALVPGWGSRAIAMQLQLLDAFSTGDTDEAERISSDHTLAAGKALVRFLETKGIETH